MVFDKNKEKIDVNGFPYIGEFILQFDLFMFKFISLIIGKTNFFKAVPRLSAALISVSE